MKFDTDKKDNRRGKKGQEGVALLMSLGILSLLIVIVVGFVFSTKTELLVAKVHDFDSTARAMAEDNISWLMGSYEGGYGTHEPAKDLVGRYLQLQPSSTPDSGVWPLAYDYAAARSGEGDAVIEFDGSQDAWALSYGMGFQASPDQKYIKKESFYPTAVKHISWWPLYSFEGAKDLDGKVIIDSSTGGSWSLKYTGNLVGRYTFLMIDEGIKFDINGLVEAEENGLCHGQFFKLDELLTELNVNDVAGVTAGLKKRATPQSNGLPIFWDSWEHIWRSRFLSKNPDFPTDSEEDAARNIYNNFTPHTRPSGEYYVVVPKNRNNEWYSGNTPRYYKYFHRYYVGNLAKTNVTVDELVNSTGDDSANYFADKSNNDAERFESQKKNPVYVKDGKVNVHAATRFIPWLDFISGEHSSGSDSAVRDRALQRQVAANLIDYSDEGVGATTNYNPNDSTQSNIVYCGLEKVPYVSAAVPYVQFTGPDPGESELYVSRVGARVNLVNMYKDGSHTSVNLKVKIPYISIDGQRVAVGEQSQNVSCDFGESVSVVVECSQMISSSKFTNKTPEIFFPAVMVEVYAGGELADVSVLKDVGKKMGLDKPLTSYTYSESNPYFVAAVFRDPRANSYVDMSNDERKSDYTKLYIHDDNRDDSNYNSSTKWESTPTRFNSTLKGIGLSTYTGDMPGGGYKKDNELDFKGKDFSTISTTKIRDGQIRSLWELGVIHRGEPWRTLNLRTSVKGVDVQPGTRGRDWEKKGVNYSGKYFYGDAAILDQVKLTREIETYPQVNPFNPSEDYWQAVFSKFKTGQTNSPDVTSIYMDPGVVNSGKYYIWPTGLTGNEYDGLIKVISKQNAIGNVGSTVNSYRHVMSREGLPTLFCKKDGSARSEYGISKTEDLYEEELIGKVADHLKVQHNFFRLISTVQLLTVVPDAQGAVFDAIETSDKEDPRLTSFIKLTYQKSGESEEVNWYKIRGAQKLMTVLYRFPGLNKFTIIEKQIISSDY